MTHDQLRRLSAKLAYGETKGLLTGESHAYPWGNALQVKSSSGWDGVQGQAHVPIREALYACKWPSEAKFEVFLQGSYKNDTNLGGDSDSDVVVRLAHKLNPGVAALSGEQLQRDGSHRFVLERWQSFRDHAMKAMRARFGNAVKSGRKTLKLPKGKIPVDADLVVTLSYMQGIGFYLPDEERWVVSYPQQHHQRGLKED